MKQEELESKLVCLLNKWFLNEKDGDYLTSPLFKAVMEKNEEAIKLLKDIIKTEEELNMLVPDRFKFPWERVLEKIENKTLEELINLKIKAVGK